jgi:hypothetical protein
VTAAFLFFYVLFSILLFSITPAPGSPKIERVARLRTRPFTRVSAPRRRSADLSI